MFIFIVVIGRDSYDHILAVKHNKKFFQRLKTVGPYYKKNAWEEDYLKQVIIQHSYYIYILSVILLKLHTYE